eukprot:Clim_evm11s202 gene=Clim_evmTU11s202
MSDMEEDLNEEIWPKLGQQLLFMVVGYIAWSGLFIVGGRLVTASPERTARYRQLFLEQTARGNASSIGLGSRTLYLTLSSLAVAICVLWIVRLDRKQERYGYEIFDFTSAVIFLWVRFIRMALPSQLSVYRRLISPYNFMDVMSSLAALVQGFQNFWTGFAYLKVFFLLEVYRKFHNTFKFGLTQVDYLGMELFVEAFVYIFAMAATIQLVEIAGPIPGSTFNPETLSNFFNSVYFIIVTMSTVGYGDLTTNTAVSRVLNLVFIAFGIIFFTSAINRLSTLLERQRLGQESYEPRNNAHFILVLGDPTITVIRNFCSEFYHLEGGRYTSLNFQVVLLINDVECHKSISRFVECDQLLKHQVRCLQGSVIDTDVQKRCALAKSYSVFVFPLASSTSDRKDLEIIFSAMMVRPVTQGNIYLMLDRAKHLSELASTGYHFENLMCKDQMRMGKIALAFHAPGFSTLLYNMVRCYDLGFLNDRQQVDQLPFWQKEYLFGCSNVLYDVALYEEFEGQTFQEVILVALERGNILPIAMEEYDDVTLNPWNRAIGGERRVLALASHSSEIRKIGRIITPEYLAELRAARPRYQYVWDDEMDEEKEIETNGKMPPRKASNRSQQSTRRRTSSPRSGAFSEHSHRTTTAGPGVDFGQSNRAAVKTMRTTGADDAVAAANRQTQDELTKMPKSNSARPARSNRWQSLRSRPRSTHARISERSPNRILFNPFTRLFRGGNLDVENAEDPSSRAYSSLKERAAVLELEDIDRGAMYGFPVARDFIVSPLVVKEMLREPRGQDLQHHMDTVQETHLLEHLLSREDANREGHIVVIARSTEVISYLLRPHRLRERALKLQPKAIVIVCPTPLKTEHFTMLQKDDLEKVFYIDGTIKTPAVQRKIRLLQASKVVILSGEDESVRRQGQFTVEDMDTVFDYLLLRTILRREKAIHRVAIFVEMADTRFLKVLQLSSPIKEATDGMSVDDAVWKSSFFASGGIFLTNLAYYVLVRTFSVSKLLDVVYNFVGGGRSQVYAAKVSNLLDDMQTLDRTNSFRNLHHARGRSPHAGCPTLSPQPTYGELRTMLISLGFLPLGLLRANRVHDGICCKQSHGAPTGPGRYVYTNAPPEVQLCRHDLVYIIHSPISLETVNAELSKVGISTTALETHHVPDMNQGNAGSDTDDDDTNADTDSGDVDEDFAPSTLHTMAQSTVHQTARSTTFERPMPGPSAIFALGSDSEPPKATPQGYDSDKSLETDEDARILKDKPLPPFSRFQTGTVTSESEVETKIPTSPRKPAVKASSLRRKKASTSSGGGGGSDGARMRTSTGKGKNRKVSVWEGEVSRGSTRRSGGSTRRSGGSTRRSGGSTRRSGGSSTRRSGPGVIPRVDNVTNGQVAGSRVHDLRITIDQATPSSEEPQSPEFGMTDMAADIRLPPSWNEDTGAGWTSDQPSQQKPNENTNNEHQ